MKKRIHLLCSKRNIPNRLLEKKCHEDWVGVDRGTFELLQAKIQPVYAVGDFDSVTEHERRFIESRMAVEIMPKEKDLTDLAYAVQKAIEMGYKKIKIYGATGGRLDHFMGAMQILKNVDFKDKKIQLIDKQNIIELLTPGKYKKRRKSQYTYVSFVPATDNATLTLKGFKYTLEHQYLEQGSTLTISNEFKDRYADIIVHEGLIYQIRSKD
ncbi:thiamine diphosphokinase [Staphylococcus hyicus]|uniref:thiamine diphosphokinase n=1 Tax=Staphylococcus hyicus TaxID=1284 RepID=UPI00208E3A96|nr:thiamine diphosphokinase [Staphylococcus hyicus]MCO4330807.1 thiamine diphosphokinase [Staphylococcus hyicus]MCO4334311.1 thiamine diphosphokinase [Staphylococcus hyicus]